MKFLLCGIIVHAQNNNIISNPKAIEVYGTTLNTLNNDQLNHIASNLNRTSIREQVYVAGETIPSLSSLGLIKKFNTALQADDFSNPHTINPLKYAIDYFQTKELVYRIGSSNYVLVVNPKQ
jgi:hypothetical protein